MSATTEGACGSNRRSAADRALVAPHTKRKQQAEAEAEEHDAPQGRMTLELRARSVIDDTSEERPFGRSRARSCASLGPAWGASLGPAWAALHAARHTAPHAVPSPAQLASPQVLAGGKAADITHVANRFPHLALRKLTLAKGLRKRRGVWRSAPASGLLQDRCRGAAGRSFLGCCSNHCA